MTRSHRHRYEEAARRAEAARVLAAQDAAAAVAVNGLGTTSSPHSSQPPSVSPDELGGDAGSGGGGDGGVGISSFGGGGTSSADLSGFDSVGDKTAAIPPCASQAATFGGGGDSVAVGPDDDSGQLLPLGVMGSSPETFHGGESAGYAGCVVIEAAELYRLIDDDSGGGTRVLVIDTRPTSEFKASHIEAYKEVCLFVCLFD